MDSPRGRIYLMKLGLEGQAAMTDTYVGHFDKCLGCMACLTACPSGVQYEKLIEATRPQIERRYPPAARPTGCFARLLFALFPHPGRLRALAAPFWLYQRSGLQKLVRWSGAMKLLPRRLGAMEALAPPVRWAGVWPRRFVAPPPRASPACGSDCCSGACSGSSSSDVNRATARVLAAEGCEVIVPPRQGCCGALMVHAGEEAAALDSGPADD